MKKIIGFLAMVLLFAACASDNDMKYKETDTKAKTENQVGVQNVNGNIPDTVNTINIGTHKPNSTAGSDSLKDSVR